MNQQKALIPEKVLTVGVLIQKLQQFHESDLVILEDHQHPIVYVSELRIGSAYTNDGYRVIIKPEEWRVVR